MTPYPRPRSAVRLDAYMQARTVLKASPACIPLFDQIECIRTTLATYAETNHMHKSHPVRLAKT